MANPLVNLREGGIPVSLQEPLEGVPRKYLNKIVSLTGRDGFLEAVNRGTLADYFHNLTGFSIASASELGLDSDGRLFGSKIDFENKILNVSDLDIRDSKEICLFNCVVLGDLHIDVVRNQGVGRQILSPPTNIFNN
ncbi:MAG TPA: hypothetical protein VNW97_23595 [Candidatus Saccharimonadales bacterium]|nr:hypothetical protein [Candidatus Saccharimonadales bacterium]